MITLAEISSTVVKYKEEPHAFWVTSNPPSNKPNKFTKDQKACDF